MATESLLRNSRIQNKPGAIDIHRYAATTTFRARRFKGFLLGRGETVSALQIDSAGIKTGPKPFPVLSAGTQL